MTFEEMLDQAVAMLQRRGRVTYRALKAHFQLDDDLLETLKDELLFAHPVVDQEGRGLIWTGAPMAAAPVQEAVIPSGQPQDQATPITPHTSAVRPIVYTPRHLAERILAEQAALEARGAPDGERKIITALFADIKGSMDILEELDPEEARRLIDPALQLMMDAVHRYEGYVAQSLGDGIFALFGAPIAHEDHAQRALYAALRMQDAIKHYANQLRLEHGIPLEIRIGLNTGEVVVRSIRTDDLHTDYVPIGHATSLAARLQGLATGGAIVVSEATYTLTEGYVAFHALGAAQIKGVSEPVPIYEVQGVGPLRTRLQVAARRGLVRFVGRQRELEQLQRAWEQAQAGRGQIVAVVGEPGVGKSRLCYEFKLLCQRSALLLETFSVSHGKAYPYLPLLALLNQYFQLSPQDDERRRREQIMGKVLALDRRLEEALAYLFVLLGVSDPLSPLPQMDPQLRRRRTLEAITRLLLRESLDQPLLLLVEDLHWLDGETEAWLQLLTERLATARILLLVNYRPEYQHPWGSKTYYTQLRLDPLDPREAEELLTALLGDDASLQALKQLLLVKTEGNPFFLEELVQALLDQGVLRRDPAGGVTVAAPWRSRPTTAIQLPPTVQGVLAARIDRLPAEEKALLQTMAVIGKEFPLSLLTRVAVQPEDELQGGLAHLQAMEFICEQPAFPESEYAFKHALTQEVAYTSLLQERRRGVHERAAQAIEALWADRLEAHYGELAHHYCRSGNTSKAVDYLQRAGQQAVQRSAYAEAIDQLTTALELLHTLPESPERASQELALQVMLGPVLGATKGYAAPEVEQVYARARQLCEDVGETPQLFPMLWGLWRFYHNRAAHATARQVGEQLLSRAQVRHDPELLVLGHAALGISMLHLGELTAARSHLEQGIAFDDGQRRRAMALRYSIEPGIVSRGLMLWDLWALGYPDQALAVSHEALTLAHALGHPWTMALALTHAAVGHISRREAAVARERAEALIALCTEHGFPLYLAWGTGNRGWALAAQGQRAEGIAQLRQCLNAVRAIGAELAQPTILGLLAEVYGAEGQAEAGLDVLSEALDALQRSGERWWEAELHRLKGELLVGTRGQEQRVGVEQAWEAEACFRQAFEVARRQQAKSWELRAAMSLARLWQRQGKREEARRMLGEIYGWFTEGFDTADLQEARALLETLA